jgi:hypothetical protein
MYRLHHQGDKNRRARDKAVTKNQTRGVLWMLVTADVVPSTPIFVTLTMEAYVLLQRLFL